MAARPSSPSRPVKPRLRGVSHLVALAVFLVVGAFTVAGAPGAAARLATGIYVAGICALFGASAVYHVPTWSPSARRRLRRVDHSAIFLAIAGTYTPVAALALGDPIRQVLLWTVWLGAAAGIAVKVRWIDAPPWVQAVPYILLGWVALAVVPALASAVGWAAVTFLLVGGGLYTLGAVVYARKSPDPAPATFGYHEVFHALVIVAVACHYVVVVGFVLPQA